MTHKLLGEMTDAEMTQGEVDKFRGGSDEHVRPITVSILRKLANNGSRQRSFLQNKWLHN